MEINRNVVASKSADYDYEVTQGFYHAYFKDDLTKDYPVAFETKDGAPVICANNEKVKMINCI